jgi:hypothetical protein
MTGERRRREEEEKIMPSLMATSLRWRTHSARTKISYNTTHHHPHPQTLSIIYWSTLA